MRLLRRSSTGADELRTQPVLGRAIPPATRVAMAAVSDAIALDAHGGASLFKALVLGDIIASNALTRFVEIGVYRGRLLLMIATLMRDLADGQTVGIDPYSAREAAQRDAHDRPVDLVSLSAATDWEAVYNGVLRSIDQFALQAQARIIRRASHDAAGEFEEASIDMLHVDGNHDRDSVAADIELYLPKLRPGGFVVLDDVSWESIRPALEDLLLAHQLVFLIQDSAQVRFEPEMLNDFAIVRVTDGARRG
jgi:hypothetical protein